MSFESQPGWRNTYGKPALATMIYFGISIWLFHGRVMPPMNLRIGTSSSHMIWQWLLFGLPLVGAAGAWRSWRAGGTAAHRLLAALTPAGVLALLFGIGCLIDFSHGDRQGDFALKLPAALVAWLILPAVALAAGAVPFVLKEAPRQEPRG